ncbi:MAG: DNA topoisomerase IB [Limnobacter sp.]|nr:DNA topoisomerase IB [Limnobacter sp.]
MKSADSQTLVYVSDASPGISRYRRKEGFAYRDASGNAVRDSATLARIRALAIPPAYDSVWICPIANGHLQATGRDARGRKQYQYHPAWRKDRDDRKYERLAAFGRALPRIRARISRDIADGRKRTPTREIVLATMVRLLDLTCIRVGSKRYLRSNGSYGLTTLRSRHVKLVDRESLRLSFAGKGGIRHEVALDDPRVARVVRRLQHLPGQELFQYLDDDGQRRAIGSSELNDYLERIAGDRFTAKDFRTWHATVTALEWTCRAFAAETGYSITRMLEEVARQLGNTPAVCRNAYIHPNVLGLGARLTEDTAAFERLRAGFVDNRAGPRRLYAAERRLLAFLERDFGEPIFAPEPERGAASRRRYSGMSIARLG